MSNKCKERMKRLNDLYITRGLDGQCDFETKVWNRMVNGMPTMDILCKPYKAIDLFD